MSVKDVDETEVISGQDAAESAGNTAEFEAVRTVYSTPNVVGPAAGADQPSGTIYPTVPAMPAPSDSPARVHAMSPWAKALVFIVVAVSLVITMSITTSSHKADEIISQQTTAPVAAPKPNSDLSLSGLKGEYWSNAKKILSSRDADLNGMVVLTDDGKEPIADANWTVEEISKSADGHLEVRLAHEQDLAKQAAGVAGQVGSYAKDAWDNLKDGTMGLGNAR